MNKTTIQENIIGKPTEVDVRVTTTKTNAGSMNVFVHVPREIAEDWGRFIPSITKDTITLRKAKEGIKVQQSNGPKSKTVSFRISSKYSSLPIRSSKMKFKVRAEVLNMGDKIVMPTPLPIFKSPREIELLEEAQQQEAQRKTSFQPDGGKEQEDIPNTSDKGQSDCDCCGNFGCGVTSSSLANIVLEEKVQLTRETLKERFKELTDDYESYSTMLEKIAEDLGRLEALWDSLDSSPETVIQEVKKMGLGYSFLRGFHNDFFSF